MRFTFRLISTLCVLFFASSAYAATLSVSFDGAGPMNNEYNPGATLTVTLVGTKVPYAPTGVEPTDAAQSIDVRIVGSGFTSVSAETGQSGTCIPATGCLVGAAYSVGGTQGTTTSGGDLQVFSQIGGLGAVPLTNNMTVGVPFYTGGSSLTAVFTTIAGGPGTYPIDLSGVGVGWFGITGPQNLGIVPIDSSQRDLSIGAVFSFCRFLSIKIYGENRNR